MRERIHQTLQVPGLLMIGRKESIDPDGVFDFEQLFPTGCLFKQCFNSHEEILQQQSPWA